MAGGEGDQAVGLGEAGDPRRGLGARPGEDGAHGLDSRARHLGEFGVVLGGRRLEGGAVPHHAVEAPGRMALGRFRRKRAGQRKRDHEQREQSPPHQFLPIPQTPEAIEKSGRRAKPGAV